MLNKIKLQTHENCKDEKDNCCLSCVEELYIHSLAVQYTTWQIKDIARSLYSNNYSEYELMKVAASVGDYMSQNNMDYIDYALDDKECFLGFLEQMTLSGGDEYAE